jgi:hypothetical protein
MTPGDIRIAVAVFSGLIALSLIGVWVYDRIDRRRTHKWIEKRLGGK